MWFTWQLVPVKQYITQIWSSMSSWHDFFNKYDRPFCRACSRTLFAQGASSLLIEFLWLILPLLMPLRALDICRMMQHKGHHVAMSARKSTCEKLLVWLAMVLMTKEMWSWVVYNNVWYALHIYPWSHQEAMQIYKSCNSWQLQETIIYFVCDIHCLSKS